MDMTAIIGELDLDGGSMRQLSAFLTHYRPRIITPATRHRIGWVCTVEIRTKTITMLTWPEQMVAPGLARAVAEMALDSTRAAAILHIRPRSAALIPIDIDKYT